jgi:hypothetical protein
MAFCTFFVGTGGISEDYDEGYDGTYEDDEDDVWLQME